MPWLKSLILSITGHLNQLGCPKTGNYSLDELLHATYISNWLCNLAGSIFGLLISL